MRETLEMGLVGVLATQLWHHTFIDGSLADLPSLAGSFRSSRSDSLTVARERVRV
jgi:asparagine synthase (glutamine-hydrolysing)